MRTQARPALLILLVASCVPSAVDTPVEEPDATLVEESRSRGEAVYNLVCWACHGLGGHGDGPVADSLGAYRPPTFHTQDLANADPEQLLQAFLGSQADDPEHPHAVYVLPILRRDVLPDIMEYVSVLTDPPEVPGSGLRGRTIYGRLCSGCHGPDGRSAGVLRAFMIDEDPIDLTADPRIADGAWREMYFALDEGSGTFHGSRTPAWGLILYDAEIWDLVAYLATLPADGGD